MSLAALGYWHDTHAKVWSRHGLEGAGHSAADQEHTERVEERISRIVDRARDRSLFSAELSGQIDDWPTRYHLSASRANLLRPFQEQFRGADVLEIGAACGAITRFLGESGANVVALEASASRASIVRARTRDLQNVEVRAEDIFHFNPETKFDFITLIGILEHAGMFSRDEHPASRMIERARELLKPDGRLIIAIENQAGIHYFAGVPEDHSGQSMDGFEGRYDENERRTYGREELLGMVNQAGFAAANLLAPFPDYQFPVSMITEAGFADGEFDSAALASEWVGQDPQLTSHLAYAPSPAWPIVGKNALTLDLSNSFLLVAGQTAGNAIDSSVLAYHYPALRSREYYKEITYVRTEANSIELRITLLETHSEPRPFGGYRRFSLSDRCDYVQGNPLSLELTEIILRDGWNMEEVGSFINRYLDIASSLAGKSGQDIKVNDIASPLSGRFFDLIPRHIIIGLDGEIHAIDQEWDFAGDISVGLLVFRALIQLLYAKFRFAKTESEFRHTRMGFMVEAFRAAGFKVTEEVILSYAKLETASQSEVAQRRLSVAEVFAPDSPVHFKTMADAYGELSEKLRLPEQNLVVKSPKLKEGSWPLECAGSGTWARLCRWIRPAGERALRVS